MLDVLLVLNLEGSCHYYCLSLLFLLSKDCIKISHPPALPLPLACICSLHLCCEINHYKYYSSNVPFPSLFDNSIVCEIVIKV